MSYLRSAVVRTSVAVLTMGSVLCAPGCSVFVPNTQTVAVRATDPKADIYVDNQPVGTGTAVVTLKKNRDHHVMAKNGNKVGTATINKRISPTGILDIVGGCLFLVPFIGVFGGGFWELDDQVGVALVGEQ